MSDRPIIHLSRTTTDLWLDIFAIAGVVATLAIAVYGWQVLPERIPTHFGFDGKPNGWGSKSALWLLPGLALVEFVVLTYLRRFPHVFNYAVTITEENAATQYRIARSMLNWLRTESMWMLAYINWQILESGMAGSPGFGLWFLPLVILTILGTVAYWIYQSFTHR